MPMNRYLQDRANRRMIDGRNPRGSRGGYISSRKPRDYAMNNMDYAMNDRRYDGADYHRGYERYNIPMQYEMYGMGNIMPTDFSMDGRRDYRNDNRDYRMNDYRYYEDYARNNRDYGSDYKYDYANNYGNDYDKEEKEYKKDLEELIERLKKKDRFSLPKEEIIKRAKQKGVNFDEFDELEFYAVYLMIVSDHKKSIVDPNIAILQAQEFFEDDDIAVSPSEKICIYMYKIILGE